MPQWRLNGESWDITVGFEHLLAQRIGGLVPPQWCLVVLAPLERLRKVGK